MEKGEWHFAVLFGIVGLIAEQGEQAAARGEEAGWFTTTHWTVVLAAGHGSGERRAEALERLCQTYWRALY